MKTTLKRFVSLLLVAVMLVSSFGGFGTLNAHAEVGAHFTLINYDHSNYLHIENDKTLQLDLAGRSGTIGAISWWLTDTDGNLIEGTAQNPVFDVTTSADAAALGAAGDVITLHGDVIAAAMGLTSDLLDAELGVTPTIPKEGVDFFVHCKEDGNMELDHPIHLVSDWTEACVTLPDATTLLVGERQAYLNQHFDVWYRDAANPDGTSTTATITNVSAIRYYDETGALSGATTFIAARNDAGDFEFLSIAPGSADFRATYTYGNGQTGNYEFTLHATTKLYELQAHFPNGTLCMLKNGSMTMDAAVLYRTAELQEDGNYAYFGEHIDTFTLTADSSDPALVSVAVSTQDPHLVELNGSAQNGGALVTFTAAGTHNGEPFTTEPNRYWIDLMDHYAEIQFEGFDPSIPVGETLDTASFFRCVEYTYDPSGNIIVDRTADTDWTFWDDNNVFTAQSSAELPVLERTSPDPSTLWVSAELNCGSYGVMENTQCFGVDYAHTGGPGHDGPVGSYGIWWDAINGHRLFDTETLDYMLYTDSLLDTENAEVVVEVGYWDDEDNFVDCSDDVLTVTEEADGVLRCTVDGEALLERFSEHPDRPYDEFNFDLYATIYVDGEAVNGDSTHGSLCRTRVWLDFPQDQVNLKLNGSLSDSGQSAEYYYEIYSAEQPYGEGGWLSVSDMQVSNVVRAEGCTADVSLTYSEDFQTWLLDMGSFFEGSYDITLYYTDPLTREPAEYTYTSHYVNEIWWLDLSADCCDMLPGEERLVYANVERSVYDADRGSVPGSTEGVEIRWYPDEREGVTYTPDGDELLVRVDRDAETNMDLFIRAEAVFNGEPVADGYIDLSTRSEYYVLHRNATPDPELGQTVTLTPMVDYVYFDDNGIMQRDTLNAADNSDFQWYAVYEGCTPLYANGELIGEPITLCGPYALGTTFSYTRLSPGWGGVGFMLNNADTDGLLSFERYFSDIEYNVGFNHGSYELAIGETLDLSNELHFQPGNLPEYLNNTYWNDWGNGVIEIDENGVVTAITPGETCVWFGSVETGNLAECWIYVYDPSNPGGGDVFFGDPAFRHIFENQKLFVPLDTTLIHGNDELHLELEAGYWPEFSDEFIPFDGDIMKLVYDGTDPTLVVGFTIDGEALHAAADEAIPYGWDSHCFVVYVRTVYEDGNVHSEDAADFEMRKTRVDYQFEQDTTLLADITDSYLTFSNTYGLDVYFGHDNYEYGEPFADGRHEEDEFWIQRCKVVSSSTHTVTDGTVEGLTFEEDLGTNCYVLCVPAGFIGDIEITQIFTGRFAQGGSTPYTFTVHVVPELWTLHMELEGREWSLLPGEERTLNAFYDCIVYDPEQGQIFGNIDGASIKWRYDPMHDVTYEANGNSLTVKTGANADFRDIMVGASLMKGGEEILGTFDMLWVTHDYHTIVNAELPRQMELGESKTFTPDLHYYWLDENRAIRHDAVHDSDLVWFIQCHDDVFTGLTANGQPVAHGDTFPLGTTFTYTHSSPGGLSFAIEAIRPGEEYQPVAGYGCGIDAVGAELYFTQDAYLLQEGDTLKLKNELVYTPANLLEYLGELSWVSDTPEVATVDANGKVNAVKNGIATILLQSSLSDYPIAAVTVIVTSISSDIEDSLPEQDVSQPVDDLTVVADSTTKEALKNETADLMQQLADPNADASTIEEIYDGDVDTLIEHIVNGDPISSRLSFEPLKETDVDAGDRDIIKVEASSALGHVTGIAYFDASVQVFAGDEHIGNRTAISEPMTIRFAIPTELRSSEFIFTVFRLHNGVVEALETTVNSDWTVSFLTDKFSTYALGYSNGIPSVTGATRLFGNTRYETSFNIANEYKAVLGAEKFENIIIASGVNFPDALAGSYLAAKKNAPILMAKVVDGQLQNADQLKTYIDANLVPGGQIYVLGGPTAIPTTLEDALSGLSVKRLQGNSRYDTNIEILKEAGITGDTLLVCTGKDYADALSASASGLPILLIDGKSEGVLRDAQKDFLEQYDFSNIYILGGPLAVNEAYDGVLGGYADTVERLAGINRRATSVLVAETFFTAPDAAVVAYSKNFPDGLCGGPLANALGAPILLTETANPTEAINYARTVGINAGYALGGSGLVSDDAVKAILGTDAVR